MKAIVTIKITRNPKHDPHRKRVDWCPLYEGKKVLCSDSTGEHHSYIETGNTMGDILNRAKGKYGHVTRVEVFDYPELTEKEMKA